MLSPVKLGFFFIFGLSLFLAPMLSVKILAQLEQSSDNFDTARSSSDEALSLIDSLKGSSLLDSVVEDMQNISYPAALNQTSNNQSEASESLDNTLSFLLPNNNTANATTDSPIIINSTSLNHNQTNNSSSNIDENNGKNTTNNYNLQSMQSMIVTPYPMTISSEDYVPLYSSMPLKIENGNILAKLPCNSTSPLVEIVGSSSDNNVFPIHLNPMLNFSKTGSMCMYQSIIPDDLSNLLYSHTLTNIYLYNPLDFPIDMPTTTSIFIGIHKMAT